MGDRIVFPGQRPALTKGQQRDVMIANLHQRVELLSRMLQALQNTLMTQEVILSEDFVAQAASLGLTLQGKGEGETPEE